MKMLTFKRLISAVILPLIVHTTMSTSVLAGAIMSSPLLPPFGNDVFGNPTGYLSAAAVHATFMGPGLSIVLSNVIHRPFNLISRVPDGSGGEIETFNSTLTASVSINAGPLMPFSAMGPVMTRVHYGGGGPIGGFATEMLALNLMGGIPGVFIRESPTLQSLGQTTVQNVPGGFQIDSFFDVFTELSVDGGATWMPSIGAPTRVELQSIPVPEPGTFGLLIVGVVVLRMRRKSRTSVSNTSRQSAVTE